jgi:hypothetical protein
MDTELDLTILEDMEFAPVCEYVIRPGAECPREAEWLYIALSPEECGCVPADRFFCTRCKNLRLGWAHLRCSQCGEGYLADPATYRFEPISGTV